MTTVNANNSTQVKVTNLEGESAKVTHLQDVTDGSIRMGTLAGTFHDKTEKLKASNPTRMEAEAAFKSMKVLVQGVIPKMESMWVDCDYSMVTITLEDNTVKKLTIGQLKELIAKGSNRNILEVQKEIVGFFHKFDMAFLRMGISTLSHYSPKGPDRLGSELGGKALNMRKYSAKLVHDKQSPDLATDAGKKQWGILSLIGHSHSTESEKKKAVDKALRAEGFLISFRDSLTAMINERIKTSKKETDPEKKREFNQETNRYVALRDQLLQANRHALWVSAIYDEPKECYRKVLEDHYEDAYADRKDPSDKPSFRAFCESSDSLPYRDHAAEIASLLITDPAVYRSFCQDHGIEPRDNHINRLLNQALKEPDKLKFQPLGLHFKSEEEIEVKNMMNTALDKANSLGTEVDKLAKPDQTAQERLKTAVTAKSLFPLLKDNKT